MPCRLQRSNLMGTVKQLEIFLGRQQLRWNRDRLLAYAQGLHQALGSAALRTPLADLLLNGCKVSSSETSLSAWQLRGHRG